MLACRSPVDALSAITRQTHVGRLLALTPRCPPFVMPPLTHIMRPSSFCIPASFCPAWLSLMAFAVSDHFVHCCLPLHTLLACLDRILEVSS